jgi:decaprenylphospho-beta-D-erythro-pentofuranosid-2-ulose 2-reductase
MLEKSKSFSTVVLIGSTSEIGIAILSKIKYCHTSKIFFIGREEPMKTNYSTSNQEAEFIKCDLLEYEEVCNVIKTLEKLNSIDLVIIAAGYLPYENKELDSQEVRKTLMINAVAVPMIVSSVMKLMQHQISGRILLISSVASMRPRTRNFTYGASKNTADFFAVGLINKFRKSNISLKILRPGFVHTKLTKEFKPAPFATSSQSVAKIAVQGLFKKQKIIYAPKKLRIVMLILQILPRSIFNRLG